MKRTSEEYLLMTLSFGGACAITPIAVIRALNMQWVTVTVDLLIITGMLILGCYVYFTRQVKVASVVLSILTLSGMITVVYLNGYLYIYWAYPSLVAAFYLLTPRVASTLAFVAILALLPAMLGKMDTLAFMAALISLIIIVIFSYIFSSRVQAQSKQLAALVKKDPLTGVGNRRALDEKLEEYCLSQGRTGITASLILLDLDHFKKINDIYGHIVGDQVLIKFTDLVNNRIRISDNLFRFGGEEFVIIALGTSASAATILAEDLRRRVEAADLLPNAVTVSQGIAEYRPGESSDDWLHRCDTAMYEAKHKGRNKVCVAQ